MSTRRRENDPFRPHADDEFFHLSPHEDSGTHDKVTVETIERWKESEMSGDEYRFSYRVTWWRNGMVFDRRSFGSMAYAQARIGMGTPEERDEEELARRVHSEREMLWTREREAELCAQPACSLFAVAEFRLRKAWCNRCGEGHISTSDQRRRFCGRHLLRGDCGLDDADANYVVLRTREIPAALDASESWAEQMPWTDLPLPFDADKSPEWRELRQALHQQRWEQ